MRFWCSNSRTSAQAWGPSEHRVLCDGPGHWLKKLILLTVLRSLEGPSTSNLGWLNIFLSYLCLPLLTSTSKFSKNRDYNAIMGCIYMEKKPRLKFLLCHSYLAYTWPLWIRKSLAMKAQWENICENIYILIVALKMLFTFPSMT